MQNTNTGQMPNAARPDASSGFEARFSELLAEMSDQDDIVARLLEAQGLERDELGDLDTLPEHVAEQLDDAADERIEDARRMQARPLAASLSLYALRA